MVLTDTLTEDQEAQVARLVGRVLDRVSAEVRLGIGDRCIDPDAIGLDIVHGETDPVVADAVRRRLGIGVAA